MKRICENCRYYRQSSAMSMSIPGAGNWCSNSRSPEFRTRKEMGDKCSKFDAFSVKAPLWMRVAKWILK